MITAEGENFTAGLDMPKFFGPGANPPPIPETNINAFGLGNTRDKPIITAVQGICFTIGIEMALAGDIIVAADNTRFCQMEAKRGLLRWAALTFVTSNVLVGETECIT